MPDRRFSVDWQVYRDEAGRRVVRRGRGRGDPGVGSQRPRRAGRALLGPGVLVPLQVGPYVSPVGRARTAPHASSYGSGLAMAFVSCAQYEHGYFTAYRRLAEEHPDLILHLGDYQYEYRRDTYTIPGGNVRDHEGPETETPGELPAAARPVQDRPRPAGRARRRALAGRLGRPRAGQQLGRRGAGEAGGPQPDFLARREAAFRAYYENMPLRRASIPRGIDMQLYRRIQWGRLANFHMLDTRQYRSDQGCGDGYDDCPEAVDPDPFDHRCAQERVAARRLPPLAGAVGHPRPAGLLRPARQQRRTGQGHQSGRLGRLRRLPAADHPGLGRRQGAQPRRAHRRRARPLGRVTSSSTTTTRPRARSARSWSPPPSPPAATAPTPTRRPSRS